MSAKVRLNKKELLELIEAQEAAGTDATELRSLLAEVEQDKHIVIAPRVNDDDYVAELRGKSSIERGAGLECMVCHDKFDQLVSGTCEACFREWALSTRKRD
ncbi:unnamed protein product [marine sediment metagenome]|uniref:Uncharacterized protein n=1 Tax=marine sediment metagenome TaxID=412755 RepID=X1GRF5_9ZZZZ